jgi:serine/threonine protein kinase/tetratricopeptide (TPR) repeat protein
MIDRVISHYRILEHLGGGGMGIVYRAEDLRLRRTVVLKFLPPEWSRDSQRRERLLQEARATSALDHPNICTIYEIDETDEGDLFIAMAHYEGEGLDRIVNRGPMALPTALRITMGIGEGLRRAHQAGVIHRDVKPANVILTRRGEVKILDFGLAKVIGQTGLTQTGTTLGTAAYMSPEQISAMNVDRRTDVWSLGVVMYEMVAGIRPFPQDDVVAVIAAILNQEPPPVTEVRVGLSDDWHDVLARAMAKNRDARYSSMDELLGDVKALARTLGISSDPLLGVDEISTLSHVSLDAGSRPTIDLGTRSRPRRLITRRTFFWLSPLAAAAAAAAFVLPGLLRKRPSLVVRDFKTASGLESRLGRVVACLLATRLETLEGIEIIDEEIHSDLSALYGANETAWREKERVQGVIAGDVSRAGSMLIVEARFSAEDDAKPITTSGDGPDSLLLFQIDALAEKIATYAGHRFTAPTRVAEMTTPSYAAFVNLLVAREHWETLSVSAAQEAVDRSLKSDPDFALARYLAAQIAVFLTRTEEAAHHVARAQRRIVLLAPTDRYRLLALKADLDMNVKEKIENLERVIDLRPRDKTSHYDLAEAYFHRAEPARAIPHYERSLAIRPDFAPSINHLGYCRLYQGQNDEGILLLERYRQLTGEANAFDSLGDGHFFAGNYLEAITNKETALAKDPSLIWVYGGLAYVLFLKGCVERAFSLNQRALDSSQGKDRAFVLVQRAHFKRELNLQGGLDDIRAARALYDVENIRDLLPEMHALNALLLLGAERIDEAREETEWMRRVIERHHVNEVNYFPLLKFFLGAEAELLIADGRTRDGRKAFARLERLGERLNYWTPPFTRAHFTARKAWAELRIGELAAAEKTIAEGLEIDPRHPDLRIAQLAALKRRGDDAYGGKLSEMRSFYDNYPRADPGFFDHILAHVESLAGETS